ncbi:MAG TPA: hypothetical protein VKT32_01850 [Chthonomonadaceae bacterium]|nr:hypothetical protein [Chthonomonadaceae bacterium]
MSATMPQDTTRWGRGLFAGLLYLSLSVPAGAAGGSQPRMPEGSFLRRPAPTTQALRQQLASDLAVRTRYARLFHMAAQMVAPAFYGARLTRLKRDEVTQVFYVRPGEHIGYRLRRLRKGTLLYTLRDGTPALVQACGNPLRRVLPIARSAPVTRPPGAPIFLPVTPSLTTTVMLPPAAPLHSVVPPGFVEVAVPPPGLLPPPPPIISPAAATAQARHWFNAGLLALPFGALPFLGGSSSHASPPTGGGAPPGTPPPVPPPGGGVPPGGGGGGGGGGGFVPEPDTLTLLLGGATPGLLLLAGRRLRQR